MRKAIDDKDKNLGFSLERRKSRRVNPKLVTDLDFADDIALLASEIDSAQKLLHNVEIEAKKVGLSLNAKKTEVQSYNIIRPLGIHTIDGQMIREVNNFKYLGGWTESSESDFNVRKALAWKACHKLKSIWNSKISRSVKQKLFISTVESVLIYGSETWTLTKKLTKSVNIDVILGC